MYIFSLSSASLFLPLSLPLSLSFLVFYFRVFFLFSSLLSVGYYCDEINDACWMTITHFIVTYILHSTHKIHLYLSLVIAIVVIRLIYTFFVINDLPFNVVLSPSFFYFFRLAIMPFHSHQFHLLRRRKRNVLYK